MAELRHTISSTIGREWTVTASHFGLSIDGKIPLGFFTKVSGLGVTMKTQPVVEGGQNDYIHKLPGPLEWEDLRLERGLVITNQMLKWLEECRGIGPNKVPRRGGHITMFAADRKPLRVWEFRDAFPVKWTGPSFDASSDTAVTEALVLAHAGLKTKL